MPKDLAISRLLDVYGSLLPEKQRLLCELYYDEDLSLAEISENEGITRQGARDSIKRAEGQLRLFEEKLGMADLVQKLRQYAENGDTKLLLKFIEEL